MANYIFECDKCGCVMEFSWSMKDYEQNLKKQKCYSCKSKKIFRSYGAENPYTKVKNIDTIGKLADKNSKIYKNKINEMQDMKPKPRKPWYHEYGNADIKTINKMNDKQKIKYIMEGKT